MDAFFIPEIVGHLVYAEFMRARAAHQAAPVPMLALAASPHNAAAAVAGPPLPVPGDKEVLQRLLDSEGGSDKKQGSSSSSSKGKKQKGKNDVNWLDAVEATIQLVGWAKTEQRRERIRRNKRFKIMSSNEERVDQANNVQIESFLDGFTGGGDDLSSVDCYSYSSDSEYEDDGRRTQNTHRIAVKKGEILEELIQKDPKFS